MLTARWSGCSGSCTLLVSHRIDSYDMSTLPWRCFDFCVVDRLDAMPWVQLVPKKHGSSLLRWCKDFIKNGSSLLLHVRFAAVALLFASEKKNHQLLGGWIVFVPWGLPTSCRATIPLPPAGHVLAAAEDLRYSVLARKMWMFGYLMDPGVSALALVVN